MGNLERGASYPAVRDNDVLDQIIPVPSLSEQHKIVAVLGLVQRAIEQQDQLLALTAELKNALLHKLFTEGLRSEPQKQTEIGPVPESWEVVTLGSRFDIKHGYAFEGKFFTAQADMFCLRPVTFLRKVDLEIKRTRQSIMWARFHAATC